jgi:hypothetical protein
MRNLILIIILFSFTPVAAQKEQDTTLNRCPVFITDTASSNNFFIEARPCTIKVYRLRGNLTVAAEQRDQFLTIVFADKKLRANKYKIQPHPDGRNEVSVKYSFRSGDQVSYVNVASGSVETTWDKEKKFWKIKVNGMIANLVDRTVSYYRVRADFNIL